MKQYNSEKIEIKTKSIKGALFVEKFIKYMRLHKTGIIFLLFTISFNLFSNKFWLTTYEFPYGPKTGISLKNDTTLFVGIYNGVIKSSNSGQHFEIVLNSTAIYTIFISKSGNVFAGGKGKIFKSEDNGNHWDSISVNTKYPVVQITENSKGKLFAVTNGYDVDRQEMSGDNVLFSEDGGQSWTVRNAGLKQYGGCNKIIVDKNDRLYTAVVDDNVTGTGGLYISNNEGLNWVQININYDGLNVITGSPRIQQITGLSVMKNDSVYVSLEGVDQNAEVRLNLRKHIDHISHVNNWNVYKVSETNSWWLDRPLNDIYQAGNGDRYSSYSQKISTGGTYFKKSGNYPWNRIDTGLGLDVTGVRTHQYFAETSRGKVYMIQMYDERIYWADTSRVDTGLPDNYSERELFYCTAKVTAGAIFEVKILSGYHCEAVQIYGLSGKNIISFDRPYPVIAPSNKGIYLISISINNKKYCKKLLVI